MAMTISAVSSFRSLDLVPLLGRGYREGGLPSWTPEWTDMGGPQNQYQVRYLYGKAKVPVRNLDTTLKPWSGLNPAVANRPRFDATAGSQPIVKFHGPVLTARGHAIDSIHTLSSGPAATGRTAMADGCARCESTSPTNPCGTKAGIFCALWRTLTICGNWSLVRDDEDYLTGLWSRKIRKYMQHSAPAVLSWVDHNEQFLIHGHTLRQWVEDFKWSYKPFRKILSTKNSHNTWLRLTFGSLNYDLRYTNEFTMVWDIYSALEMNYQLLITAGGYVGWTSARSQEGDLVCLILGCSTPVILRRRNEGGYRLTGVSYILGLMDGERMKDLRTVQGRI